MTINSLITLISSPSTFNLTTILTLHNDIKKEIKTITTTTTNNIKTKLTNYINSLKNIKRVRNFWEIYSANNYQPIEFYGQGAVQKIIDNDLNIQVNQLKQLQKYHVQFTDLLKTSASMIQVVIDKYKLQLIMDNVEKINLQIALKTKMLSEMKRILARM